jgi:hypothetical protein
VSYGGVTSAGQREHQRLKDGSSINHNDNNVLMQEPMAATSRQDTGMGNAAHGEGRRHQTIKDDGMRWHDPVILH